MGQGRCGVIHDEYLRGKAIAAVANANEMVERARAGRNVHTNVPLEREGMNTVYYNASALLERLDALTQLVDQIIKEP